MFDFDYGFHTIPCVGFQVHYRGRSISYSGDTKYDPDLFPELVRTKVMSPAREAALRMRGFAADIVIHELGPPPTHTDVRVLNDLPMTIKRKLLVVHCAQIPESATAPDGSTVHVTGLRKPLEGIENTVTVPLGDFEEGFTRASRRLQLLCASPYLRSIAAPDVHRVFAAVSEASFPAGTVIVRAGDPAPASPKNTLYIIEEGKAEMYGGSLTTGVPVSVLDIGDMFGHIADGATTIVAKTDLSALSFAAEIFTKLPRIGNSILRVLKYRSFIHASLAKNAIFRDLSPEQIAVISSCVSEEVRLSKNERLIRQGDNTDRSLYIIRDGNVRVERIQGDPPFPIEFARLGPG
jgi:CRP-like cAMP-binding protein